MSRTFSRNAVLSRDTAEAIKIHCWGNVSEFYRRYTLQLDMSQATFYRTLSGEYSSDDTVGKIVAIVELNRIGFKDEETQQENVWNTKKIYIKEMFRVIDAIVANPSLDNLSTLKIFAEKYRRALEQVPEETEPK